MHRTEGIGSLQGTYSQHFTFPRNLRMCPKS
jgi:hypothetical protein